MKKYGLTGYPLSHSFSRRFFTDKFAAENIAATYDNYEISSIDQFREIVINNPELIGLNVTIPYKEQVIPLLDEVNESAQEIGAVNTVKITRTGREITLTGYNTDAYGFEKSLTPLLKPHHRKALILGTGGASKAVKYVLTKLNINYISASIEELRVNEIRYTDINSAIMAERLLIINATPLGTYPKIDTFPPIPYDNITEKHLLFDLVYNPEETVFMQKGRTHGAVVKNGYEMLVGQALRAWEIWNN